MGGKTHGGQKAGGQKAGGQKAWGAKGWGAKGPGAKDQGAKDRGAKDRGGKSPRTLSEPLPTYSQIFQRMFLHHSDIHNNITYNLDTFIHYITVWSLPGTRLGVPVLYFHPHH